jgi:Xaa-Pro aminopeptidase
MEDVFLYTQRERFDEETIKNLAADGITIKDYELIYEDLESLRDTDILIDKKRVNVRLYESIGQSVKKHEKENPTVLMKAIKNETEIANLRAIHIQDGLAVTRFMFWLKDKMESFREGEAWSLTECDAANYLDDLRSHIAGFCDLSFDTISAANANAAMMHYHATENNCAVLYPEGMLLVDSGGQYFEGTTDVTRTFALGKVTEQMKKHFTLTLKGMLQLTHAKFLKGCTGFNLDILARQPLWEEGIDYRCGTGHGIGYFLNVHESPNGFRWKHNPGVNDLCVLEPGMVTSNEPGVYIDGEYGIRIENEIVCVKDYENEYGTFLKFDTLTYVPIDLELVDKTYLNSTDIERLNSYHQKVYDVLSPYMPEEECQKLRKYTRTI